MVSHDTIFTVGHSNHPADVFLGLLRRCGISAVADVRSAPFSRRFPQFDKPALSRSLKETGFGYVFMGRALGARPDDPSCYAGGRVSYARLAARPAFLEGIARLKRGARNRRIALMCAEREPLDCHRTILVARALDREGIAVEHIHADGRLEPHGEATDRLFDLAGVPRDDMFLGRGELAAMAFSRREARIAYRGGEPAGGRGERAAA